MVSLAPRVYPLAARLLCNEEEAEDAVQETMLKLWKKRDSLNVHPNLDGFVFLTVKNHCLDVLKQRKYLFEDIGRIDICDQNRNDNDYERQEHHKLIKEIIDSLPENLREVIILRDIDGLEYDEISAITGKKAENLRVMLSRARSSVAAIAVIVTSFALLRPHKSKGMDYESKLALYHEALGMIESAKPESTGKEIVYEDETLIIYLISEKY